MFVQAFQDAKHHVIAEQLLLCYFKREFMGLGELWLLSPSWT